MNEGKRFGLWLIASGLCVLAALHVGCSSYVTKGVQSTTGQLSMDIYSDEDEYLVVRVDNTSGTDHLNIDWAGVHLRWPNGFESPVEVTPEEPLSVIYPGGTVEYHVKPRHFYLPPDKQFQRRNSLSGTLFPSSLYAQFQNAYVLTLFIPVCMSTNASTNGGTCDGKWTVHSLQGSFVRLNNARSSASKKSSEFPSLGAVGPAEKQTRIVIEEEGS